MSFLRLTVGFIGLGQIGSGMAERLLESGHHLVFYARNEEVRQRFTTAGGRPVRHLEEVATGADVVIVCVLTDQQVAEVTIGDRGVVDAMGSGAVLVIHTTGSPVTVRDIAAKALQRHAAVVDAPVSGSPADAREGHITLLVGGDGTAVARVMPVLSTYGSPVLHLGGLGAGQQVKLINNLLLASHVQLAAEAIRIAEFLGHDRAMVVDAIGHCSGASRALAMAASRGPFDGIDRFLRKDVIVAMKAGVDAGVDLGFLGLVAADGPARFGEQDPGQAIP